MQIFISYSPDDYGIAHRLYNDLKKHHLKPWLDQEDLLPGQNWKNGIKQAIRNSKYFLTLISSKSVSKQGFVQKEQRIALELIDELPPDTIFIIPVSVDGSKSAFERMTELHPVNLSQSYDKGLEKILNFVRQEKSDKTEKNDTTPTQDKPDKSTSNNNAVNTRDAVNSVIVSGSGNTTYSNTTNIFNSEPPAQKQNNVQHAKPDPKKEMPLWKKGLISATGAIALFVVVYKVNPPELIHQQSPPPIEQKMKQPLSGIVLDEKGNPLSGVVVSLSDFSIAKTTNDQGAFSFEVEAEKQTSVRLMAQKQGFMTWRQDATLGNTSLSFRLEKEK